MGTPVPIWGLAPTATGMPTQPCALCTVSVPARAGLWALERNPQACLGPQQGAGKRGPLRQGRHWDSSCRAQAWGQCRVPHAGLTARAVGLLPLGPVPGGHTARPEDRDGHREAIRTEGWGDFQSGGALAGPCVG